jgi:hypothetical protein
MRGGLCDPAGVVPNFSAASWSTAFARGESLSRPRRYSSGSPTRKTAPLALLRGGQSHYQSRCMNCHPAGDSPTRERTLTRICHSSCGRHRHEVHVQPWASELRPGTRARTLDVAFGVDRDGVVVQNAWRDLRAGQGSEAERRQDTRRPRTPHGGDPLVGWGRNPGVGRHAGALVEAWWRVGPLAPPRDHFVRTIR